MLVFTITDKSESLHAITFLALYSTKLPLSVTVALKEDRIVAIRRFYTSLSKLKSSTNKLLLNLVKELLSIPRSSGTWTKSFLMVLKRDNTSIISSKLITLISAPQLSIDTSEKDSYLSLLLT